MANYRPLVLVLVLVFGLLTQSERATASQQAVTPCSSYTSCADCTVLRAGSICGWCASSSMCTDTADPRAQTCPNVADLILQPAFCPSSSSSEDTTPAKKKIPAKQGFIILLVGCSLVSSLTYFLRYRQVGRMASAHASNKTDALDWADLDAHAQSRLARIVASPDVLLWGDAALPVPSFAAFLFLTLASLIITVFGIASEVPLFLLVAFIFYIIQIVYSAVLLIKVITRSLKYEAVYAMSNYGLHISGKSFWGCGGERRRTFKWHQIRPSDIHVQSRCVPSGVGHVLFAFEMKDVTAERNNQRNNGHAFRSNAIHLSRYSDLNDVKDHVDENTDVHVGGRTFRKVAVGFKNVVFPNHVEALIRERVNTAHSQMSLSMPVMGMHIPMTMPMGMAPMMMMVPPPPQQPVHITIVNQNAPVPAPASTTPAYPPAPYAPHPPSDGSADNPSAPPMF